MESAQPPGTFAPKGEISLTDASLLEETYQTKENEQHNQTYAIEEQILRLVRTGNYRGFKNIEFSDSNYHLGITGSTALRQLRNDIIITTTICTRAAIEGGLDYDSAYKLSDYFIQLHSRNQIYRSVHNRRCGKYSLYPAFLPV
mgnify:CR=1 FL=1